MAVKPVKRDNVRYLTFHILQSMEKDIKVKCPSCGVNHFHEYLPKHCHFHQKIMKALEMKHQTYRTDY